jgi:hypothetical protein
MGGCAYADTQSERVEYQTDVTLGGDPVVVRVSFGGLTGMRGNSETVGYFGGGNPRFIGFGCDDANAPVIAMSEDSLNNCQQVHRINPRRVALETR